MVKVYICTPNFTWSKIIFISLRWFWILGGCNGLIFSKGSKLVFSKEINVYDQLIFCSLWLHQEPGGISQDLSHSSRLFVMRLRWSRIWCPLGCWWISQQAYQGKQGFKGSLTILVNLDNHPSNLLDQGSWIFIFFNSRKWVNPIIWTLINDYWLNSDYWEVQFCQCGAVVHESLGLSPMWPASKSRDQHHLLSLLLVLPLAPRRFSLGTLVFLCLQKLTFSNSNLTRIQVHIHEEPLCMWSMCYL